MPASARGRRAGAGHVARRIRRRPSRPAPRGRRGGPRTSRRRARTFPHQPRRPLSARLRACRGVVEVDRLPGVEHHRPGRARVVVAGALRSGGNGRADHRARPRVDEVDPWRLYVSPGSSRISPGSSSSPPPSARVESGRRSALCSWLPLQPTCAAQTCPVRLRTRRRQGRAESCCHGRCGRGGFRAPARRSETGVAAARVPAPIVRSFQANSRLRRVPAKSSPGKKVSRSRSPCWSTRSGPGSRPAR